MKNCTDTELKKESDWSKLSEPVKTILEQIDMSRIDTTIKIESMVDIPYFNGIFTSDMANEILNYQHSDENEGCYSATIKDGSLKVKFLKGAFD